MPKIFKKSHGFTLIEILVSMAILAVLSVIGLVVFSGVQNQARKTKVQQDFEAISKQIQLARQQHDAALCSFSGDYPICFSDKVCRMPPATTVMSRANCLTKLQTDWSNITGQPYDVDPLPTDPWGTIYMFDENEMEPSFPWPFPAGPLYSCRWDMLRSAGPDGIAWNNDDFYYFVPPFACTTFEFPEQASVPGTRIY